MQVGQSSRERTFWADVFQIGNYCHIPFIHFVNWISNKIPQLKLSRAPAKCSTDEEENKQKVLYFLRLKLDSSANRQFCSHFTVHTQVKWLNCNEMNRVSVHFPFGKLQKMQLKSFCSFVNFTLNWIINCGFVAIFRNRKVRRNKSCWKGFFISVWKQFRIILLQIWMKKRMQKNIIYSQKKNSYSFNFQLNYLVKLVFMWQMFDQTTFKLQISFCFSEFWERKNMEIRSIKVFTLTFNWQEFSCWPPGKADFCFSNWKLKFMLHRKSALHSTFWRWKFCEKKTDIEWP